MPNRIARSFQLPGPHTTHHAGPRWAVQRVGSHDETSCCSSGITLHFDPQAINPDQILGFQPRVGQVVLLAPPRRISLVT